MSNENCISAIERLADIVRVVPFPLPLLQPDIPLGVRIGSISPARFGADTVAQMVKYAPCLSQYAVYAADGITLLSIEMDGDATVSSVMQRTKSGIYNKVTMDIVTSESGSRASAMHQMITTRTCSFLLETSEGNWFYLRADDYAYACTPTQTMENCKYKIEISNVNGVIPII